MAAVLVLSRTILALVLIWAGAAKLADNAAARQAMLDFRVPARLAPVAAWLLPLAEFSAGAALVPAWSAWWGAQGAFVLFATFLAAIGWNLVRGRRPDCRCFGQLRSAPIGWKALVRSLALLSLATLILVQPGRNAGPGLLAWMGAFTTLDGVAVGFGAVACSVAAIEGWLLWNLLEQNSRLIRRLDALEAEASAGPRGAAQSAAERIPEERHFGLSVGMEAPAFALPDLDGVTVSLSDLRTHGKPILLLFMHPGCGPCSALLPDVVRWRHEYGAALTIAMLSRGTLEVNRAAVAGHDVGTVLLEAGEEIAGRYQALGTPSAVLVNPSGRIASSLAQGAEAIRRLVARSAHQPARVRHERAGRRAPTSVGMTLAALAILNPGSPAGSAAAAGSDLLQVADASGWRTWWRSDSAPESWSQPVPAVLDATTWWPLASGADLGELVISGGSLGLRTRIILGRFDPGRFRLTLARPRSLAAGRSAWTIDSAERRAVLAFNGGQFAGGRTWGWLVHEGRELQPPAPGPLSMAVAETSDGSLHFVSPESLPLLRAAGDARTAFQSYPALLIGDGRVPAQLRARSRLVDLDHRDARLAICQLADGRVLVALTRFDNLGRVFGALPVGLTLEELVAVMGALGCRRAVSLDGGLSAQLLVRPVIGPVRRWAGNRSVPLGIEVVALP